MSRANPREDPTTYTRRKLEAEVLPHDQSVFDWSVEDTLGFYRQGEKYEALKKEFASDQDQLDAIETMWEDRKMYHRLKKFPWPPKNFVFFSRGYYHDYASKPRAAIQQLTLSEPEIEELDSRKKSGKFLKVMRSLWDGFRNWEKNFGKKYQKKNTDKMPEPLVTGLLLGDRNKLKYYNSTVYDYKRLTLWCDVRHNAQEYVKRLPGGKLNVICDGSLGRPFIADWVFEDDIEAGVAFDDALDAGLGLKCTPKFRLVGGEAPEQGAATTVKLKPNLKQTKHATPATPAADDMVEATFTSTTVLKRKKRKSKAKKSEVPETEESRASLDKKMSLKSIGKMFGWADSEVEEDWKVNKLDMDESEFEIVTHTVQEDAVADNDTTQKVDVQRKNKRRKSRKSRKSAVVTEKSEDEEPEEEGKNKNSKKPRRRRRKNKEKETG